MKKLLLTLLLVAPFVANATTSAPWSITNTSDTFIFPNLINGVAKGVLISASSTINSTLTVSSLTNGNCVQAGLGGLLTTTSSACGSVATSSLFTGTTGQVMYFQGANAPVGTSSIFITTGSNVGIGTTTPVSTLDVWGFINTNKFSGYKQDGNTILYATTTTSSLTVGSSAAAAWLSASSTALANIAIGSGALGHTPTDASAAQYNIAIGVNSLSSITTGGLNTAVGGNVLAADTSGQRNGAFGYNSLVSNTTGSFNNAVGYSALSANKTGSSNTALGYFAIVLATSSSNNTAVGYQAGFSMSGATGAVGGSNTLLGYQAGFDITLGSHNLVLGDFITTGSGITTGSNNILLGQNLRTGFTNTSSNQLNIGNLIFGTGLGSGTTLGTGNVGIGTSTPYSKLAVWGGSTGNIFEAITNASSSALTVSGTGFGTTTVTGLNISGSATTTSNVGFNVTSGCFAVNGSCALTSSTGVSSITGTANQITASAATGAVTLSLPTLVALTNASSTQLSAGVAYFGGTATSTFDSAGNLDISQFSSIKQAGNTILYASSTNKLTAGGDSALANYVGTGSANGPTAFGYQALNLATSSLGETAFGYQALKNSSIGSTATRSNTAVGYQALLNATSSVISNTAVGYKALTGNATNFIGSNSTAVGANALTANTTGIQNTAIGSSALLANTTGTLNNAFGHNAMSSNTTGNSNMAFGSNSVDRNTTGKQNVGIGDSALDHTTTGDNNVGIGYLVGTNNSSATNTVSIGSQSTKGTGAYNAQGYTVIGYLAGSKFTTGADYNTLIGYNSGNLITTGANNILIGAASTVANDNLTTGSGNIKIGYNISFPSPTANGQLNIGNLIFGTDVTGTGSTVSTGNVGIGTTTPFSKFHVTAGASATTTVNFGEVGSNTSFACFNTKNTAGTDISFYFVGTSMVVESNLCR